MVYSDSSFIIPACFSLDCKYLAIGFYNNIIKIFSCDYEIVEHNQEIGSVIIDKKSLKIACKDGLISLQDIQMESKKRMDIKSFIIGYKF